MTPGQFFALLWLGSLVLLAIGAADALPKSAKNVIVGLGTGFFVLGTVACVWIASGITLQVS